MTSSANSHATADFARYLNAASAASTVSCAAHRRDRIGAWLMASWLSFAVVGFWAAFVDAAPRVSLLADETTARQTLENWFANGVSDVVQAGHRSSVFYFPSQCSCASTSGEFEALIGRWSSGDVAFEDVRFASRSVETPALPAGADLLVFSANGHLAYAGPLHASDYCGGTQTPADVVLQQLRGARSMKPLLLQTSCGCARS